MGLMNVRILKVDMYCSASLVNVQSSWLRRKSHAASRKLCWDRCLTYLSMGASQEEFAKACTLNIVPSMEQILDFRKPAFYIDVLRVVRHYVVLNKPPGIVLLMVVTER